MGTRFFFIFVLTSIHLLISAQGNVGIGTENPDASAILELQSSNSGLLIPRMTTSQIQTILNPAEGLLVFNTDKNGFSYFTDNAWVDLQSSSIFEHFNNLVRDTLSDNLVFVFGKDEIPDNSTNTDTLFFYDDAKGALRSGKANSLDWAPDSIGTYSVAFGEGNKARGEASSAFGMNNDALGDVSMVFGRYCSTLDDYSIAGGYNSDSYGNKAIALGTSAKAYGDYSTALGNLTIAEGDRSLAFGWNTTAFAHSETVFGRYNEEYTPTGTYSFPTNRLFVIGNGTSLEGKNAFTLQNNGHLGIGELASTPSNLLHLNNGATDPLRVENLDEDLSINDIAVVDANGVFKTRTVASLPDKDEQELNLTGTQLSIDDGNSVDLSVLQDGSGSDDQNLTGANLTGTSLQIDIENGNSVSVDLASIDSDLDQQQLTLTGSDLSIDNGNSVDLSVLQDGTGTDDQDLTAANLAGNILTIEIENGDPVQVNLGSLDTDTDDQFLSFNASTNELTIDNGNTVTVVDNDWEVNGIDIYRDNGKVTIGSDTPSDHELTISALSNEIQIGNTDNSSAMKIEKNNQFGDALVLNQNSTYSLSSKAALSTSYATNISSKLSYFDQSSNSLFGIYAFSDDISGESAMGHFEMSTDGLVGNGDKFGVRAIVDLDNSNASGENIGLYAHLDGSGSASKYGVKVDIPGVANGTHYGIYSDVTKANSFAAYFLGNVSIGTTSSNNYVLPPSRGSDGYVMKSNGDETVSWIPAYSLPNIDNQYITQFQLSGSNLILTIEDGNSISADLAGLASYSGFDDQDLSYANLTGTTLEIGIEDGSATSVDLAALDTDTDEQDLTGATLTGNSLQIDIENGSSVSVDLSNVDTDTDQQTLSLAGTDLSIQNGNSVDLTVLQDGTGSDDQNLTSASLTGNILEIDIENGDAVSVDLSALDVDTDDQELSIFENGLSIDDGNTVDLSYLNVFENNNGLVSNTGSSEDDFIFGSAQLPMNTNLSDTLFFFDQSKAAFRVGRISSTTNWGEDYLGTSSFASGFNTIAEGTNAAAFNYYTSASGTGASSFGFSSSAEGSVSVAMGSITQAIGYASFSMGESTKAEAINSFAIGRYNVGGGDALNWVDSDPLFEIGVGTGTGANASNALTVLKNGRTGIGTPTPDETLSVVGLIRGAHEESETNYLEFGHDGNDAVIVAEGTGNVDIKHGAQNLITLSSNQRLGIKTDNPQSDLHILQTNSYSTGGILMENEGSNGNWAKWYVANSTGNLRLYSDDQGGHIGVFDDVTGVYSATSDRRLKESFEDLRFDWDSFMKLIPLLYEFKADESNKKYIGMVAQDVKEVYPEIVTYDKEEDLYHLDYAAFGVIAIKAIQEQQRTIDQQKSDIQALQANIETQQIDFDKRLKLLEAMIAGE